MATITPDTSALPPATVPTPPGQLAPVPPVPNVTTHVSNAGGERTVFVVDRAANTVHVQQPDGTLRTTGPTPHIEGVTKLPLLSDAPGDESLVDELSAHVTTLNDVAKKRDFAAVKDSAKAICNQCDKIATDAKAVTDFNQTPDAERATNDFKLTPDERAAKADAKLTPAQRADAKAARDAALVVQPSPPAPPLA